MINKRKLILFIAASLDGYIADRNDNLDFLALVEKEGEDYGYSDFTETVDTVVIGRKTYDKVQSMGIDDPHPDKKVYVITRTAKPSIGNTTFYNGDINTLIKKLKQEKGSNIFCDGGAELVNLLLKEQLIDELIISIIPVLLGKGKRLFDADRLQTNLMLIGSKQFERGLVQLHYTVKKQ